MRKTSLKLMACLVALVMILSIIPSASALSTLRDMVTDEEVTFIVVLEDDCSVQKLAEAGLLNAPDKAEQLRTTAVNVANSQKSVINRVQKSIVGSGQVLYTYKAVLNGFSMKANMSDQAAIEAIPGVKAVYVSQKIETVEPVEQDEDAVASVEFSSVTTGAAEMHEEGYRGQGQVIAIVDTTFDTNHEFLNGSVENPRYTKDDMAELLDSYGFLYASLFTDSEAGCQPMSANQVWKSEKVPFAYNYTYGNADTYPRCGESEHGSHVAGIAAGKNGTLPDGASFDGVAPEAQLLLMAVPDADDACDLAAIDDAILLGADVINMSWGVLYYESDLFYSVFDAAREYGTYLCHSAGNSSMGWFENTPTADIVDYGSMAGRESGNDNVTNVATSDNAIWWGSYGALTLDNGTRIPYIDENEDYPFFEVFSDQEYEYVYVGELNEDNIDVEGKIAVFDRGTHGYYYSTRMEVAVNGGAIGVIFLLTDGYKMQAYGMAGVDDLPTAAVRFEYTDALRGSGTLISDEALHGEPIQTGSEDNIQVSSFSSWGVFDDLSLDPDITAPGGYIYSSTKDDQYEVWSGTSMASPHMAGAMALINQYLLANEEGFATVYGEPDEDGYAEVVDGLTPAQQLEEIDARAMSTAKILTTYNSNSDIDGVPYSPRLQGAGLLQIPAAAKTPVVLLGESGKCKVELRDGLTDNITFTFTAKNLTDEAVTYDVTDIIVTTNDSAGGYVLTDSIYLNTLSKTMPETVTVPAHGTNEIAVNIKLDPEQVAELEEVFVNGFYVDGYVVLATSDESLPTLSIPFMGFHGDWEDQHVLDPYLFDEENECYTGQTRLGSGQEHYFGFSNNARTIDVCFYLGTNIFCHDYSEFDTYANISYLLTEYDSGEFAAISPNWDGLYDYLCVSTVPLRQVDAVWCELYDSEGNLLYIENAENEIAEILGYDTENERYSRYFPVSIEIENETFDELGLGEGDYVVKLYVQRGDKEPEMAEMPFYIDNTVPEIESWEIYTETVPIEYEDCDENGEPITVSYEETRTFLKVKATDDKNLMGFELQDARTDTLIDTAPIPGGTEGEAIFDITIYCDEEDEDWFIDHYTIFAVDYAYNWSVVVTNDVPGDITDDGEINNQDLVLLARVIAGFDDWYYLDGYQKWCCDFNGDDEIDNIDLVMMARYIAGIDNYAEVEEDYDEPVE